MKNVKRVLSLLLCLMMVITAVPMGAVVDSVKAFAAELTTASTADATLKASLNEAKAYIDGITIKSSDNDPEKVVKNFGTHFTWDNEKREGKKDYLFDWSYYNGVVFEGIEYVYEVTGDELYKDYVIEYMSSLIASNGTWAKCTNSGYTSKECAGYNATHGADCYKTASLLLDAYEMTKDSRYLTMAKTLYADLDTAAKSYSLKNAGNNYRHTWDSDDSNPDLWLDGLYMVLPFRAEYAKHTNNQPELDLIVSRLQWVSDNMYNSSNGLFYHAADNKDSNSGTYWLRAIGWYAAAIVDVMDSMEGENLEAMKKQLVKLVDGMKAVQNKSNGMWLNNMAASQSSTNPYETSGTALVCYAVMKAVNNGWLDKSYADMAILAFNGICKEKLSGNNLTDICFKGAPGSGNSTFYDNEGKGVGPFIMFYAEMVEYVNKQAETPDTTPVTKTDEATNVTVTASGITGITVKVIEDTDEVNNISSKVSSALNTDTLTIYDITVADFTEGSEATVTIPVPAGMDADKFAVYYVPDDGEIELMPGEKVNDETYKFTTTHFSTYVGGTPLAEDNYKWVDLPSSEATVYYEAASSMVPGEKYIITNSGSNIAIYRNNYNGSLSRASVTIENGELAVSNVNDMSSMLWQMDEYGHIYVLIDGTEYYLYGYYNYSYFGGGSYRLGLSDKNATSWTVSNNTITAMVNNRTVYLSIGNSSTSITTSSANTKIYKQVSVPGSSGGYACLTGNTSPSVVLTNDQDSALLSDITEHITVYQNSSESLEGAEPVEYGEYTITWKNASDTSNTEVDFDNIKSVKGTYVGTVIYNGVSLGDINLTITDRLISDIKFEPSVEEVERETDTSTIVTTLTVTYSEGEPETVPVSIEMLETILNGNVNVNKNGTYSGTITYEGFTTEETFTLKVVNKTGPEINDFPEYPNEGSVDVNKVIGDSSQFQNTGVAEVQLSTSGIPIKAPVDVILVTDLSNSMAWEAGGNTDAASHEDTKMYDLAQSVNAFADTFLISEDGTENDNTISLVTFGGYDADRTQKVYTSYADPTQTLLLGSSDAEEVKGTISNIRILADDALNLGTSTTGYYLSFDGGKKYGENYGNTNYDHAFMQAYDAVTDLKAKYEDEKGIPYTESGREIFVLFMTDGAPSNYNGVYYNYKTGDRADVNSTWVNAKGETVTYTMGNNRAQYQAGPWYEYIAGGTYDTTTKTIPGNPLYWADKVYGEPGVENIFSIGFDLDNGGFSKMVFTEDEGRPLAKVLEKLVTNKTLSVYNADNEESLKQIYKDLAAELREAATNAYFVDQMGDSFDIAKKSYVTKFDDANNEYSVALKPAPQITVSTYNIYLASDVGEHKFTPTAEMVGYTYYGITVTEAMVGSEQTGTVTSAMVGKRYGAPTVIETVVFNSEGTEAYSSVDGYTDSTTKVNGVTVTNHTGTKNILGEDKVIYAKNFWYNTSASTVKIDTDGDGVADYDLPAETFYWNIGTINEKEFVLSYYVYLEGAAEGEAQKGTYATNNYATLYYENLHGNEVNQDVQSPSLAWESASVSYGFYLVDKYGNPVTNRATGAPGSFDKAVKVTQKVFYKEVLLNDSAQVATIKVDTTVVPDGYEIYDNGAEYTISVDSGSSASGWVIKNTKFVDIDKDGVADANESVGTTYVTDYYSTLSTNIDSDEITDKAGYDYTNTTVWFAVVWKPQCIEDVVVIDYGLPVDIGVLENDMFGTAGTLVGLGVASYEGIKANNQFNVTSIDKGANGLNYGSAKIEGSEVRYTPESMEMPSYDKFSYEVRYENVNTGNFEFYSGDVTVIPATTIYYEDSFVDLSSYTWDYDNKAWKTVSENDPEWRWSREGTTVDATQAEDRPGYYSLSNIDANNIYGYDKAYDNMSTYSMGSALKAHIDDDNYAAATFTFYGTGFDVISMTSSTTGGIVVTVKDESGNVVRRTTVDTYYGMDKSGNLSANNTEALYQVPVMEIEGLEYGKYTATIEALYSKLYDHNQYTEESADGEVSAKAYDFYLDAIRIYDPANDGATGNDTVIKDAYAADGESWPVYKEVRNSLISAAEVEGDGNIAGVVFIDAIDEVSTIADYVSYGPNNEVYLTSGQAIAFTLDLSSYVDSNGKSTVASVDIGLKSADGNAVTYKIFDGTKISNSEDFAELTAKTLSTATNMYYDMTSLKDATIVIANSGTSGILSICDVKITFTAEPSEVENLFYVSSTTLNAIVNAMNEKVEDVFEPNKFEIKTSSDSVIAGRTVTVTITTSTDVSAVSVDGQLISYRYDRRNNAYIWTSKVKTTSEDVGVKSIEIIAYDSDGIASEVTNVEIDVTSSNTSSSTTQTVVKTIINWLKNLLSGNN